MKILLDESIQQEIKLKYHIIISLSTAVQHTHPQQLCIYTLHANMLKSDGLASVGDMRSTVVYITSRLSF